MTKNHDQDLEDLTKVLDSPHLKAGEFDAFTEMVKWVDVEGEEQRSLSAKQREWLQRALARSNEDRQEAPSNLFSSGRVGPGKFAPMDKLLSVKGPLKPPPRRMLFACGVCC